MEYVMSTSLMTKTQQRLEPGTARRLAAARVSRRLVVTEGRLWLTGDGIEGDLWLHAGETVVLAAGAEIVAEGWPSARFELEAPRQVSVRRFFGVRRSPQPACA
jgi:hypothetical protein